MKPVVDDEGIDRVARVVRESFHSFDEFEEMLGRRLGPALKRQEQAQERFRLARSTLDAVNAEVAALKAAQSAYRTQLGRPVGDQR